MQEQEEKLGISTINSGKQISPDWSHATALKLPTDAIAKVRWVVFERQTCQHTSIKAENGYQSTSTCFCGKLKKLRSEVIELYYSISPSGIII